MGNILNLILDNDNCDIVNFRSYFNEFFYGEKCEFFELSDVKKFPTKKFYYFFYHYRYITNLVNENSPLDSIELVNTLRDSENLYFVFLSDNECDSFDLFELLNLKLKNLSLNPNKFIVINANEKLEELSKKNDNSIIGYTLNVGKYRAVNNFIGYNFDPTYNRNFLFNCYNRAIKPHRLYILSKLDKENLLEKVDWSLLRSYEFKSHGIENKNDLEKEQHIQMIFKNENIFFDGKYVDEIYENLMNVTKDDVKKSINEVSIQFDYPPYHTDWNAIYSTNPYKNSYINITTETQFKYNEIVHISEKTLVPFYYFQIPVIVATPHHIKIVKEKHNLDFFDDLINHDYDNILDNKRRLDAIICEIKRLNDLGKEYIDDFFRKNEHRLLENKRKVIELGDINHIKKFYNNFLNT